MLAASTLSLVVSKNITISSILGSLAAGLVCETKGNHPINKKMLLNRISEISKN